MRSFLKIFIGFFAAVSVPFSVNAGDFKDGSLEDEVLTKGLAFNAAKDVPHSGADLKNFLEFNFARTISGEFILLGQKKSRVVTCYDAMYASIRGSGDIFSGRRFGYSSEDGGVKYKGEFIRNLTQWSFAYKDSKAFRDHLGSRMNGSDKKFARTKAKLERYNSKSEVKKILSAEGLTEAERARLISAERRACNASVQSHLDNSSRMARFSSSLDHLLEVEDGDKVGVRQP